MSVRYKFKNDLEFSTLPCDGWDVSLRDLKKAVVRAKKLGRITDFDLVVTNEQTSQVYINDEDLIPKNSTLIVARHPLQSGQKRVWEEEKLPSSSSNSTVSSTTSTNKAISASSAISGGAFKKHDTEAESATEADKIDAMMDESTKMYASENWQNLRGRGRGSWGRGKPGGPPPPTYICASCNEAGHWRGDCPRGGKGLGQDIKRTTGIPRSFLTPVAAGTPGAKMTPTGILMGIEMEKNAYEAKKTEKPIWENDEAEVSLKTINKSVDIPEDLICPVCKDLLKDAIMMPICACPMCDECARDSLIESETNTCPACSEPDNSPDDLIPWRQMRDRVNKFKNQSGYDRLNKSSELIEKPKPVPLGVKPTLPDIYLPDPKDANFDKMLTNGQVPPMSQSGSNSSSQPIASSDSPVYGMAGPSPPNYAVSPTQQMAPSGFGINNSLNSISSTTELENHGNSSNHATKKQATTEEKSAKIHDDDTPPHSRSNSPGTKSRSPSKERTRNTSGSASKSPKRRSSTRRSSSGSGASPRSRAVPFPDISQPPPMVHVSSNSNLPPSGTTIQTDILQPALNNQETSNSKISHSLPMVPGVAPPGTLPPVIGPPAGTYAVRLPATVPSHLPPHSVQAVHPEHPNHLTHHMQPTALHVPASHPIPAYNHPPPHHGMHDLPHDMRRGPPPGHGLPPPHLPQRNMYGIDKDGFIDDPLAAFERAMAMKDANKGRVPPPRYDIRESRRRYYSPDAGRRYSSRSPPPRYRDRRSPFNRRSPTPPQYRERRHSRSPLSQRTGIHSKSPDNREPPRGPKTPPQPHPLKEGSTTPPVSLARHESPPPPPGTQSPESKRSPTRKDTPTPEKDGLQNITSTTQQSSNESKDNRSSRSPAPERARTSPPKESDVRRRSNSPQHPQREDPRRSPGPYYRRTPPHDPYRHSPSRRYSPPPGYDYSNPGPDQYYKHERHAPPPPNEYYDHRRSGEYGHPPREGHGQVRDGGYGPRHRFPTDAPPYRNEYRGRGYRGRGRGYAYNQYYPDQRRQYYNEEQIPQNYQRGNPEHEGSRRDHNVSNRSRSHERSPGHRNRSARSQERGNAAKSTGSNRDAGMEVHRKERSNSRDRTPSLTPEPEFREQQEQDNVRDAKNQEDKYNKSEYRDAELRRDRDKENGAPKEQLDKQSLNEKQTQNQDGNKKENNDRTDDRNATSGRTRTRSRSSERKGKEQEKDKRGSVHRDNRYENSRSRNRDQEYHRSRDRRDTELNLKEKNRITNTINRRIPDDRHYSSSRRKEYAASNNDQRYDRQNRRNDDDSERRKDRVDTRVKDYDRHQLSPKEVEHKEKEKKKKDKKKKKKKEESGNESGNQSETGTEKKKKKIKKDKKSKPVVEHDTLEIKTHLKAKEDPTNNGSTVAEEKHGKEEYEDQVDLHNQETFEEHISNLEQVLETNDAGTNNIKQQGKTSNVETNIATAPEVSKWERSDGDDTAREEDNSSKEDRDLREILKAKSSLSSLTTITKPTASIKKLSKSDQEPKPDYDRLIQEQIHDQDDSIAINADSEYDDMIESSDKEGKKVRKKSDRMSDSGSEERNAKKKRKKEKKEKKHKSKDDKKERKKSKKMLKELFGKDGLEELLSKLDEGHLPEDILAKAVLAKTEKDVSRSPSPRIQKSREGKEYDVKSNSYDNSRNHGKEILSRRAVVSDGKSLKMTIDRNSPREERPRSGKGDSVRRRSRDRSDDRRSRRRSHSNSASPSRSSRSDHLSSKKADHTSTRLMEMSMQSSSRLTSDNVEPQKKLSIKDRLGPIRGASSEDRPSTSSSHKSKGQSNDDLHDPELEKNQWKETKSNRPGKDERLNSSRISPSRKGKWNSYEDKSSRRNRDKDLRSECSPPPVKRSRDNSELRDLTKQGHDGSQSPTSRGSNRKSLKEAKQNKKNGSDEEESDNLSSKTKHKRTSARIERNKK